jgi:hypothetical protein
MTSSLKRRGRKEEKSRGALATLQHGEEEGGGRMGGRCSRRTRSCRELLYRVEAPACGRKEEEREKKKKKGKRKKKRKEKEKITEFFPNLVIFGGKIKYNL